MCKLLHTTGKYGQFGNTLHLCTGFQRQKSDAMVVTFS